MEIILKKFVKGLGERNEIVTVKPGYARNYLIPKGIAVAATESERKMRNEEERQRAFKMEKLQKDAASLAEKLAGGSVTIRTKAGASGKIFGSVTALQIANALKDQGFDVDRKSVSISEDIKNLGSYQATINLFKGVNADIEVHVVQE
ncbi:MAG: hypothetical protein RLZZ370_1603 [Bacteroidota bacterium]|jgi:large subunit ribosomal protein L9